MLELRRAMGCGSSKSTAKVAVAPPPPAAPPPAAPQLPGVRAGADAAENRRSHASQASSAKSAGRRGSIFQDAYDMSSFQSHHGRRASVTSERRMSIQQVQTEQEALALHASSKKTRKARSTEKAQMQREATTNRVTQVNQYKVVKPLGKGAFGEVYKVASGDGDYAMKILNRAALQRQRQGRFGSALDSVKIEIATMKLLDHPNCVHMFEVIIDPQHDEIVLILEFVPGGTSQRVGKNGVGVPLKPLTIWSFMRHLIMGLEYLHINGIVHRDIKPENLLVSPAGRGNPGLLKIADFGTALLAEGASRGSDGEAPAAQKTAGTPAFFSPETCDLKKSGTFEPKVVDLWAIGVTIYVWLCGLPPFHAPTPMLLLQEIRTCVDVVEPPLTGKGGLKGKPMGGPLIELMQGLLTKDVERRLTLAQLRAHPWITRDDEAPLPPPPQAPVVVTESDISKAVTAFVQAAGRAGAIQRLTARSLVKQTSTMERDFYDELQHSDIKSHAPLCEVRARARTHTPPSHAHAHACLLSSPLSSSQSVSYRVTRGGDYSSPRSSPRADYSVRSSPDTQDVSYRDTGHDHSPSRHLPHLPTPQLPHLPTPHLPKSPLKAISRISTSMSQRNMGSQREVGSLREAGSQCDVAAEASITKPSPRPSVNFAPTAGGGDSGGGAGGVGGAGGAGGERSPSTLPKSPGGGSFRKSWSPKASLSGKWSGSGGFAEPRGASEPQQNKSGRLPRVFPPKHAGKGEVQVEVEDLTAGMSAPCVIDIKMGCRTATASDLRGGPRADLLAKMCKIDPGEATDEERAAGGVTKLRYLQFRDRISSISSHAFRIDAAHLSPFQGGLQPAPLQYEWSRLPAGQPAARRGHRAEAREAAGRPRGEHVLPARRAAALVDPDRVRRLRAQAGEPAGRLGRRADPADHRARRAGHAEPRRARAQDDRLCAVLQAAGRRAADDARRAVGRHRRRQRGRLPDGRAQPAAADAARPRRAARRARQGRDQPDQAAAQGREPPQPRQRAGGPPAARAADAVARRARRRLAHLERPLVGVGRPLAGQPAHAGGLHRRRRRHARLAQRAHARHLDRRGERARGVPARQRRRPAPRRGWSRKQPPGKAGAAAARRLDP